MASFYLLLFSLFTAAAGDKSRRILHEPLYPIQWTPPPPPSDYPYPLTESPTPPNSPSYTHHTNSVRTKLAVAISGSLCAAAILFLFSILLCRRRARSQLESRKLIANSRRLETLDRPVTAADFLYLGTIEPVVPAAAQRSSSDSNDSPSRERVVEIHQPSPELLPLPPLRRHHLPEAAAAAVAAAAEASSDDDTYYTPKRSAASRNSESPASSRSHHTQTASFAGKEVPFSRRSSSRMQLSRAPPPPPPPPPLPSKADKMLSPLQSSRRQLLRPLPPEDAARANLLRSTNAQIGGGGGSSSKRVNEEEGDSAMVWDQLKSDSFHLNEDMIEALFVNNSMAFPTKEQSNRSVVSRLKQEDRVLDPKKSQNIAILLRALNVTREEVSEALLDGNTGGLGAELFETLVKMAPTKEEELKLRDYNGDFSKLGSAERFLKGLLDIPFAFRRVDVMLYQVNFETEIKYLRTSFATLETACEDLKTSRLFLKLLEAVLITGNRMNVGTNHGEAKAFKLDTLLKLADVKGTDGKTTVLHFVVHEISRSEGLTSEDEEMENLQNKKKGLKVVAGLSNELCNVKKAASMDTTILSSYLSKLELGLQNIRSVLQLGDSCEEGRKFFDNTRTFLLVGEREIGAIKSEEKMALHRVREATKYFHGDAEKEEAHPLRIFMVVRDFLRVLDHVCKDVGRLHEKSGMISSAKSFRLPVTSSLPVLHRYVPNSDEDS